MQLLRPSLCCEFLPLHNCQMCANMIPADSLMGLRSWPLLVLHLRSGLMLLGRVGSSLCGEGWSPVTRFKHGSTPRLCVYSFQTTSGDFVTLNAPFYIHFIFFPDRSIPFGVTGRMLESIPAACG